MNVDCKCLCNHIENNHRSGKQCVKCSCQQFVCKVHQGK